MTNQPTAIHPPEETAARPARWRALARNLSRNQAGLWGMIFVAVVIFMAVAAPLLAPHDPTDQDLKLRLRPPAWIEAGDWAYPFGTDHLGRDILSRVIYGARVSLLVGFTSVILAVIIGTTLGIFAGYYGGWLDDGISRAIDIQLAIPYFLLAVALIMVLGSSLPNLIFVLVLYGWTVYARLVRAQTFSVRERDYVTAARTIGAPTSRLLRRHILPNVMNIVLVMATLEVATMIIFEAGLSFLGLGVQPPTPSWGGMLADGRDYIAAGIWWPSMFPGLAITITALAINLAGDWLNDLWDPHKSQ